MFTSTGTGLPWRVAGLNRYCFTAVNSLLIQPHSQATDDLNPLRIPLGIDDERNHAHTLEFRPPGFVGEFRVGRERSAAEPRLLRPRGTGHPP